MVALLALAGAARAEDPAAPAEESASAAVPLQRYSLAELLALARQNSPIIAAARAQIGVREAQRKEALWRWFPSGEITFGMTLSPTIHCSGPNGTDDPNIPHPQNCVTTVGDGQRSPISSSIATIDALGTLKNAAGELNIRLTQPIYTFGKIEHGAAAARDGIEAEKARTEAAIAETELNVARAYWGLKTARTSVITASDAREQLAHWVDRIQEDVDADKPRYNYSQTDLQRIKVALAGLDILLADLDRTVNIAKNGLRAAVGIPGDLEIDDQELDAVEVLQQPLDYYQLEALRRRPEVRALDAGSRAFRELQKLQLAQMLPDIGLNLSFLSRFANAADNPSNAYMYQPNATGFGGNIGFRQPLDLVLRHANYQHARADADAFDAQRRLALAGISFEIAQAWANLNEARRRSQLLDHSQHMAQGWLNAMEQKLDLGVSDTASGTRDLVDAARSYFDTRLRYYQSIFDVNVNIAVLRRATGAEVAR